MIQLHSQTGLISEAVALLQAWQKNEKSKKNQKDKLWGPGIQPPLPLTQCLIEGHFQGGILLAVSVVHEKYQSY